MSEEEIIRILWTLGGAEWDVHGWTDKGHSVVSVRPALQGSRIPLLERPRRTFPIKNIEIDRHHY